MWSARSPFAFRRCFHLGASALVLLVSFLWHSPAAAESEGRIPGETWLRYDDSSQAGFEPSKTSQQLTRRGRLCRRPHSW